MQPTSSVHKVLIVEDEACSRRALAALLSLSGWSPTAVSSAEDALEVLEAGENPEVALVDLDLPGMNGLQFIERLRESRPGVVPVLITATSRDRLESLRDRLPARYVRKPIDFKYLLAVMGDEVGAVGA